MEKASSDYNRWTWIMLALVLVLGAVIGVGALALTWANQQAEVPTGSQSVPSSK